MATNTLRVYCVGSHGAGKTTLCRYISKKYELPMISEVARSVLAEMEVPFERLRTEVALVDDYQRKVFERQVAVEKGQPAGFVSDRAFDNLAYAAEYATVAREIATSGSFREYMEWVAGGVVFFVRPQKDLLKEDGVRVDVTWESVLRVDGMIKYILETHRVPYLPLDTASMQERVRSVDFVLWQRSGGDVNRGEEVREEIEKKRERRAKAQTFKGKRR